MRREGREVCCEHGVWASPRMVDGPSVRARARRGAREAGGCKQRPARRWCAHGFFRHPGSDHFSLIPMACPLNCLRMSFYLISNTLYSICLGHVLNDSRESTHAPDSGRTIPRPRRLQLYRAENPPHRPPPYCSVLVTPSPSRVRSGRICNWIQKRQLQTVEEERSYKKRRYTAGMRETTRPEG